MSDTSVKAPGPDGTATPTPRNMQASTPNGTGAATYFRKGFGLKSEIQSELDSDYTGHLVDLLKDREYTLTAGDVTIRLAKEFGFCYGVERAVDYAYQARKKFPDRSIYLAGEIIHNPHVNSKLQAMGITFLMPEKREGGSGKGEAGKAGGHIDFSGVKAEDVVILPAFGVTITDFEVLRQIGCVMVDTTCGSVLNVCKLIRRHPRYTLTPYTTLIQSAAEHIRTIRPRPQSQRR